MTNKGGRWAVGLCLALTMAGVAQPVLADSLWSDTSVATFFTDRRSVFVVGGLITVMVEEKLQATSSVNTKTSKAGQNKHQWEFKNIPVGWKPEVTLKDDVSFDGKGLTGRTGLLIMEITAHIDDILPNGNLLVTAQKEIRTNDEITTINLSGMVRRDDVDNFNRIASSKIADLKLDVKGTGPASAKSTEGLLTRILNFLF